MWVYNSVLALALTVAMLRQAPQAHDDQRPAQAPSPDFAALRMPASALAVRQKKGKKMNLTAQDSGRSLDLPLHETLRIELGENPTTGYRWQILDNGAPVLRLSKDSFQRGSSSAVGAGGTRILEFVTENAGTASLRMGYARSGDPQSQKTEFLLHVQVNAP